MMADTSKHQLQRVLNNLPVLSSRHFVFPRKGAESRLRERGTHGVAEASCIGPVFTRWFSRVWDDSCDLGFWMVSARTGQRVLFVLASEERNEVGELVAWKFESYGHEPKLTLTVFND